MSRVILKRPVTLLYDARGSGFDTAKIVPAGTQGTIVSVLESGVLFQVEFSEPEGLATVSRADLAP